MSKNLFKNNYIIKLFIFSSIGFIIFGSLIGSIWFIVILKNVFFVINGSIFNLHRLFQVQSGLTLLIMGIGFMIVPRFRNISISSFKLMKISFLFIILSTFMAIISISNIYESTINEKILFMSKIFRIFGILLFVTKIFDLLKIKPKLLRTSDYFIGLSCVCLLITSMLNLFESDNSALIDIEMMLLFPIAMIFGIEYKTLPSFLGFIRPRKRLGMLSLLLLTITFVLGIVSKVLFYNNTSFNILFYFFMIFSSITFSMSIYLYSNYENKKYLLESVTEKKERYLYTFFHTQISFYFLYAGAILGLLYYITSAKIFFYDLSIHFIAIGFIGVTISSYLPMMLPPILGKQLVIKRINNIPLILIFLSLLLRSIGMFYVSYYDTNSFNLVHSVASVSGFLILLSILVFIAFLYRSIKLNNNSLM